jgi:PAS domain S-box-containing protein
MHLLLVGENKDNFTHLRDLLNRTGDGQLGLDHARSPEEALIRLGQTTYDLLLCEYKSGDGAALRLLHELHRNGPGAPVIFLSDHVDEATVDAALKAGGGDFVGTPAINEPSLKRMIRDAIDVYCKDRQRQKSEDTLRKLWRAVEQSADLVIITDRTGTIEYVNPAFETLTGYSRQEVMGRTPRILKSGQQTSELYKELWETILSGNVFRDIMVNRKKNGDVFVVEKSITPLRDNEGKITHFISNDQDITNQRRLETQLQQAQKMDAIGRLAG